MSTLWLLASGAGAGVVINEFVADPDNDGGDFGFEWVELYNAGPGPVDVGFYQLERAKSDFDKVIPLTGAGSMAEGDYLWVGEASSGAPLVVTLDLGNGTSSADGLRLLDGMGNVVDTVIYGAENTDGLIDDFGLSAVSIADLASGLSTARRSNGTDTDFSGDDFIVGEPTPGTGNPFVPPAVCEVGGTVVINEFLPDPDGTDTDFEWVELYNAGPMDVRLDDWTLQSGTQEFAVDHTFAAGVIVVAGGHLWVGAVEGVDVTATLSLGNAGSNADGVRLVDCEGGVVDTVVYGPVNEDGWEDDAGGAAESLAPKPAEGASLARISDGHDTNANAADFVIAEPSPGASNPEVPPVVCMPTDGSVTLNEALVDADSTDDGKEWVELFNASAADVSVAGWGLAFAGQADDIDLVDVVLPGGTTIPAGGFLVIGGEFVDEADVVVALSIGNGTDGDGIRLIDCMGTEVDTVVYAGDEGNLDALPDDASDVAVPSPSPGEAESLARMADGVDTNSAEDWDVAGAPTPGATNAREAGLPPDDDLGGCGCGGPPSADAGAAAGRAPGEGCRTAPAFAPGGVWLWVLWRRRRSASLTRA